MIKLKFYGLGGQGVVTAAKILSAAVSLYGEKYASTVPAYGHERRGAPVYTDVFIDEEPILLNSFVYEPDIVMVMDETLIDKDVDVSKGSHENTILILNSENTDYINRYKNDYNFKKIYYVDGTQVALDCIGKPIPNGSMLGTLSVSGIVSIDSTEKALIDFFGERAGEKNARAAREAYKRIKEL